MVKRDLSRAQLAQLDDCGPDAQNHPLEIVEGQFRFKPNPVLGYLRRSRQLDLNRIADVMDMTNREHRLGIREFYRHMGYSLSGYLELFGETIQAEKDGKL